MSGRIAGLLKRYGNTALNVGIPVASALVDYGFGRYSGEDNQRALTGALAGMGGTITGETLGRKLTPNRRWIGEVIGGTVGNYAAGYTADRIDERLREGEGSPANTQMGVPITLYTDLAEEAIPLALKASRYIRR